MTKPAPVKRTPTLFKLSAPIRDMIRRTAEIEYTSQAQVVESAIEEYFIRHHVEKTESEEMRRQERSKILSMTGEQVYNYFVGNFHPSEFAGWTQEQIRASILETAPDCPDIDMVMVCVNDQIERATVNAE